MSLAHPEEGPELREKLSSETARADAAERARNQAESDRDRWRGMAEKLADKPRRGWSLLGRRAEWNGEVS